VGKEIISKYTDTETDTGRDEEVHGEIENP